LNGSAVFMTAIDAKTARPHRLRRAEVSFGARRGAFVGRLARAARGCVFDDASFDCDWIACRSPDGDWVDFIAKAKGQAAWM
jgi:hypothetical protein